MGIFLFLIAAVSFALFYVSQEDNAYYWDFYNYHEQYSKLGELLRADFTAWRDHVLIEIWASIYNPLVVLLLTPFEFLFGRSRSGYVAALVVCYLMPLIVLAASLAKAIILRGEVHDARMVTPLLGLLAVLYAPFWVSLLRGMPDVAGLIPYLIAIGGVLNRDLTKGRDIKGALWLGLSLYLMFLARRWYAYAILAFWFSSVLYYLLPLWLDRTLSWVRVTALAANLFCSGLVFAFALLLIQGGLVVWILTTNITVAYTAYQVPPMEHLLRFWNFYGPLWLGLAMVGLITLFRGTRTAKLLALFILANVMVTLFLFTRTQAIEPHHFLPISLWIYVLSACGFQKIILCLERYRFGRIGLALLLALVAFIFIGTLFPVSEKMGGWTRVILPGTKTYPLKLGSREEYRRLTDDLERLTATGDRFSLIAASEGMNETLLLTVSQQRLARRITWVSHVDLRDRFSLGWTKSRFLVTTDPMPIHLRPEDQRVITIPARHLREQTGFGSAYRLINQYNLGRGVTAFLYEQTRPLTTGEINQILEELYQFYPDWKQDK